VIDPFIGEQRPQRRMRSRGYFLFIRKFPEGLKRRRKGVGRLVFLEQNQEEIQSDRFYQIGFQSLVF
jgi:hypothetical protein